ncbi:MAG: hypothetical protein IPK07_26775 [Deltaproteobacteria bacterium]|nr:hypothetical protein [Deltaproteobacteria bacterium]
MLGAVTFAAPSVVWADDDVALRIQEISKKIAESPKDASLRAFRADLHRFTRDFDAALADCEGARVLAPRDATVCTVCGRVLADAGFPRAAKAVAETGLGTAPDDPELRLLHARMLAKLGDALGAWDDYSAVIRAVPAPSPDLFLERSDALAATGPEHLDRALGGLEEGIGRLGPVITLEIRALELEEKLGRVDAAVMRVDRLMADAKRKETWLVRKGDVLRRAGRDEQAAESYRAALAALEALPPRVRDSRAMQDLEKQARGALDGR